MKEASQKQGFGIREGRRGDHGGSLGGRRGDRGGSPRRGLPEGGWENGLRQGNLGGRRGGRGGRYRERRGYDGSRAGRRRLLYARYREDAERQRIRFERDRVRMRERDRARMREQERVQERERLRLRIRELERLRTFGQRFESERSGASGFGASGSGASASSASASGTSVSGVSVSGVSGSGASSVSYGDAGRVFLPGEYVRLSEILAPGEHRAPGEGRATSQVGENIDPSRAIMMSQSQILDLQRLHARLPVGGFIRVSCSDTVAVRALGLDGICMICLCGFDRMSLITRLLCSHTFHTACLNKWMQHGNACPLCRGLFVVE